MVGTHVALLFPTPAVPETIVCVLPDSVMFDPLAVIVPVVVIAPGVYVAAEAGIVSAGDAPPVVNAVEDAIAVQAAASRARLSVTVTVPRAPEIVLPGAPEPRFAVAGALSESAPLVTVKVTVVSGSLPAGWVEAVYAVGLVTAAHAAVEVSAVAMTVAALRPRPSDLCMNPP